MSTPRYDGALQFEGNFLGGQLSGEGTEYSLPALCDTKERSNSGNIAVRER